MAFNHEKLDLGKKIAILGFGMEGRSTFRFLKRYYPTCEISILDKNRNLEINGLDLENVHIINGDHYLENLLYFDLIIKSPGISIHGPNDFIPSEKVTSQTELFLALFRDQTIGITGTKGKSTTSSLIHNILLQAGCESLLLGNIGIPPLDLVNKISDETHIVFEMSSHQLDGISISPHMAVILNIYEEHLDHYKDFNIYKKAKYHIFQNQKKGDYLIYNLDDANINEDIQNINKEVRQVVFSRHSHTYLGAFHYSRESVHYLGQGGGIDFDFSNRQAIQGIHNLNNIMAAVCVCKALDIDNQHIEEGVRKFKGLKHRLEYIGKFNGVHFYNDSIATVPEATMEAIKTIGDIDTLILGGMDRGINYYPLVEFLAEAKITNIILMGDAGKRILHLVGSHEPMKSNIFLITDFGEVLDILKTHGSSNGVCLLSPAAPSYGMFKNFEERGEAFTRLARNF